MVTGPKFPRTGRNLLQFDLLGEAYRRRVHPRLGPHPTRIVYHDAKSQGLVELVPELGRHPRDAQLEARPERLHERPFGMLEFLYPPGGSRAC